MNSSIKVFLAFILLVCSGHLCAQGDTLLSSIGYTRTFHDTDYGRKFEPSDFTRNPVELKDAALFYIQIDAAETKGNTGFMGPYFGKINSLLIKKMEKNYPYQFEVFPNEYMYKGKEFFIEQGYEYRLLLVSQFAQINSNGKAEWRQYFAVGIEDLNTGKTYKTAGASMHSSYMKRFIKTLKE